MYSNKKYRRGGGLNLACDYSVRDYLVPPVVAVLNR